MKPITREELYLAKLAGQNVAIPSPLTRRESYLAALCGEDVAVPAPKTNDEAFLAALCGMDVTPPPPATRLQMIWAGLLGESVPEIVPVTREELLWADVPLGEYETVTGTVVTFTTLRAAPVKSLSVEIEPVQSGSGDPSPDNIRPISGWTGLKLNVSGADTTDPTTYEIDWTDEAGVVYGGTLDMTTGVLTVDRLGFVFNGAETETWEKFFSNEHGCYRFTVGAVKASASGAVRACSHFKNSNVTSGNSGIGYYAYTSGSLNSVFIQIRPDLTALPDLDSWKAWLAAQAAADTPVTCWFQPLEAYYRTYQLTPRQVRTLLGENNIWADTGDVTVEYRAD